MAILLSSRNSSVISRWSILLDGHFEIEEVRSLSELDRRCAAVTFDAILLHRMLIDTPSFSRLRSRLPGARFFLLTDRPDEEEALSFLKLGIAGYANTYISSARLIEALRIILNGGVWLGQKVIQRLIRETSENAGVDGGKENTAPALANLTKAERLIAQRVARGESNLEIAADLNITERTVKAHLTSIYEKTKTGSRLNLALLINLGKNYRSRTLVTADAGY